MCVRTMWYVSCLLLRFSPRVFGVVSPLSLFVAWLVTLLLIHSVPLQFMAEAESSVSATYCCSYYRVRPPDSVVDVFVLVRFLSAGVKSCCCWINIPFSERMRSRTGVVALAGGRPWPRQGSQASSESYHFPSFILR